MRTPEEIKFDFDTLIWEAQTIAPNLSKRLDEMRRWISIYLYLIFYNAYIIMPLLRVNINGVFSGDYS